MMSKLRSADGGSVSKPWSGEEVTYLQRELKRRTMSNSADLRGSRRLFVLCDFIGKVSLIFLLFLIFVHQQNEGCWEKLRRCCLGSLPVDHLQVVPLVLVPDLANIKCNALVPILATR